MYGQTSFWEDEPNDEWDPDYHDDGAPLSGVENPVLSEDDWEECMALHDESLEDIMNLEWGEDLMYHPEEDEELDPPDDDDYAELSELFDEDMPEGDPEIIENISPESRKEALTELGHVTLDRVIQFGKSIDCDFLELAPHIATVITRVETLYEEDFDGVPYREAVMHALGKTEKAIKHSAVLARIKELVKAKKFYEAQSIYSRHGRVMNGESFASLITIDDSELAEMREEKIADAVANLRHGCDSSELESILYTFNALAMSLGKNELLIDEEDLPILDAYTFRMEGELKPGDTGKCVLCYDGETNTVYLAFSKMPDFLACTTDEPSTLREFFNREMFNSVVGYHDDIKRERSSRVLGGAAYRMISEDEIFMDSYSRQFGIMNRALAERCLEKKGLRLKTIEGHDFEDSPAAAYLMNIASR